MTTFRRARYWLLAFGLLGAMAAGCAEPPSDPSPADDAAAELTVTEQKPEDRVLWTQDGGELIIDVWSESGIGSAVVSLQSGEMPQPIVMRFHLAGLEQMTFGFDDAVVTLSVSSHGDEQVLRSATVEEQPVEVTRRGPYWMDVQRVAAADDPSGYYYEVAAPQAFYDSGATMFLIAWIDFYR
jgi:hypothetical protein